LDLKIASDSPKLSTLKGSTKSRSSIPARSKPMVGGPIRLPIATPDMFIERGTGGLLDAMDLRMGDGAWEK